MSFFFIYPIFHWGNIVEKCYQCLVVMLLDSQSWGPMFKTTGSFKVNSALHHLSKVDKMRTFQEFL